MNPQMGRMGAEDPPGGSPRRATRHAVTLIPGDGVGPEICQASARVLEAAGVEFEWDVQQAGQAAIAEFGTPLPDHVLESIRKNRVALKGPITTPVGSGFRSVNVALRQALDLYALVRPVRAYKGARNLRDDLDFIIVRENTEDIYAELEFEDRIVDNMCMQLVLRPKEYDVLCCPNLYGDIISDLGAGMIGGLGLAPGANIGTNGAVFEATHGSAPKYTGQNRVNPMAVMLSGVMMLRYLEETAAADAMEKAIANVIALGENVTYDLKEKRDDPTAVGTSQVADAVIAQLKAAV